MSTTEQNNFYRASLVDTFADRAARESIVKGMQLVNIILTGQHIAALREINAGGFDPNVRSMGGNWTPLGAAAAMKDTEVAKALLKAGADPLMKDVKGRTAIDLAKQYEAKAVLRLLEKAVADKKPKKRKAPARRKAKAAAAK
ncbi:MAG: hypothetical protein GC185_03710 [Alphaproteobacteria bacterium]|nr:hypothetical protein [Alphaproteobacteria bacterium]